MRHILGTLLVSLFIVTSLYAESEEQVSDRIVAIVNDRIILKSDVDQEVTNYMRQMEMSNQSIQFDQSLWYEVLESIIDNYVLLEKAKMDSVVVSDDMVNRQMDQRIQQMIQQAGSERALERAFGMSIVELRADNREMFREQLIAQQVQQQRMQKVSITRPEVIEFFEQIPEDERPVIPEQVALSQIVVIPPALQDAEIEARRKAEQIRDSIVTHGRSFEEMARRYSMGPTANRGGELPMMPMSDLVAEYSAAAAALEEGEISGVVRSVFGFHIIRLNERVGENIATSNILISVGEEGLDEEYAIEKLEAIRDSVMNHGKSFGEMARRYSDDSFTRDMNGRIINRQTGQRLIYLEELDSDLYRTVLQLEEEGELTEPKSFNPAAGDSETAYRIIRLDRHIPEHRANLEQDYDQIREIALQQKRMDVLSNWLKNLRDDVHIEYKIDVPERYREPQLDFHDLEAPPEGADTQTDIDT